MVNKEQCLVIERAVKDILRAIGEDPDRSGLKETPLRVAKMYQEIFSGLNTSFDDYKLFETMQTDEMVMVKDIQFYSMCEHHLLPFFGVAHVAYLPDGDQVIGLSKIPRLVEHCAKRPSVQETLTAMIGKALSEHVPNRGIAIVMEAQHLCMAMRGVRTPNSLTKTAYFSGEFKTDRELKKIFLQGID